MAFRFKCTECNAKLKAKPEATGKSLRCPKCSSVLVVPEGPAAGTPVGAPDSSTWCATNKQKAYASKLGIKFPTDVNRQEISAMIDRSLEDQKDARYKELDDIQSRKNDAYCELRDEIISEIDDEDPRLSKSTVQQMLEELANRDIGSVLLSFEYGIHGGADVLSMDDIQLHHSTDIDETDAKVMLIQLGTELIKTHAG